MILFQITEEHQIKLDDDKEAEVSFFHWSVTGDRYFHSSINGTMLKLGEFLLRIKTSPDMVIDHKNNDRFDYQISNLRVASKSQNAANSKLRVDSTTGYKGVTFNKRHGKYYAQIKINYKMYYLGCFVTPEEAALKYNEAAKKAFGVFARLNNVENVKDLFNNF